MLLLLLHDKPSHDLEVGGIGLSSNAFVVSILIQYYFLVVWQLLLLVSEELPPLFSLLSRYLAPGVIRGDVDVLVRVYRSTGVIVESVVLLIRSLENLLRHTSESWK